MPQSFATDIPMRTRTPSGSISISMIGGDDDGGGDFDKDDIIVRE
jgi:hypothetical protein